MRTLWMDRKEREQFINGSGKSKKRAAASALAAINPQLLSEVDPRGVRIYAGLLHIGQQDLMLSIYPGCARLLDDKWEETVENYLEKYPPNHFNLNQTARRFPEYITKYGERFLRRFPYLAELADYEWLELELMEADTPVEVAGHSPLSAPEHFERLAPVVNPVLALREYTYPITSIVDHLEEQCCLPRNVEPQRTFVAVYRDPETNYCRFLEVGDVAAEIIHQAQSRKVPYRDLLAVAVSRSAAGDPQQAVVDFLGLVDKLQSVSLFVGSVEV